MKLIKTALRNTKTYGKRNEIDQIFSPVLLSQKIYGLQVLDSKWSWRSNFWIHISIFLLVTYVIFGTIDFINNTNDILLLSEAVFTIIITVELPLKYLYFVYYRSYFRDVYVIAKCTLFEIIKEISPERANKILELLQKIVKALFAIIIVPTFNYLVLAIWSYFNGTRVTLSRTTSILMPMTSPYYEIGLLLHLNFLYLAAFVIMVVDFWFVFLTYLFCETCDCAVKMLEVETVHGEDDMVYANRLNDALGKFYAVHVKLTQYLNTLNDMYRWPVLVPLIGVLMITCVFLLVMSEISKTHNDYNIQTEYGHKRFAVDEYNSMTKANWQLVTVMVPGSCEVFAYNILGERIKSKANDVTMALLNFNWTSLKLKDRKNYLIITCYTNKEFGIRTAVGVYLSLLTLSNIYKGSYQMFAVFNTMKN